MDKIVNFLDKKYFWLIKSVFLLGAFYFIYLRIENTKFIALDVNFALFIPVLLLSVFNWVFEIVKWKLLSGILQKKSVFTAFCETVGAHAVGFITPQKIGEYGAKALFYPKEFRKKIIGLTFISNSYQFATTCLFGGFGLWYLCMTFLRNSYRISPLFWGGLLFILLVIAIVRKLSYFEKFKKLIRSIPQETHRIVFGLSLLRYVIFSHQLYLFFICFGSQVSYLETMPLLFSMYLLASSIPSWTFFDFAIKGSVSLWVLSFIGMDEMVISTSIFIMWMANFAFPALIGNYILMSYKPSKEATV